MKSLLKSLIRHEATTHDYTKRKRTWGHDIGYRPLPGNRLDAHGWGYGLHTGDYILLTNGDSTTRYQVDEIHYKPDPTDMWFATLSFAPRENG
jgi:hypothetical protein